MCLCSLCTVEVFFGRFFALKLDFDLEPKFGCCPSVMFIVTIFILLMCLFFQRNQVK